MLAPGTTVGDIHITDAPTTVAALRTDMRDAGLMDMVLMDMVLRDVVLRDAVGQQITAEGSMVAGSAAAANKLHRRLTKGWHEKSASLLFDFFVYLVVIRSFACWADALTSSGLRNTVPVISIR